MILGVPLLSNQTILKVIGVTASTPITASPASLPMTTTRGTFRATAITRHNRVRSVSARVTENPELSFGAAGTASGAEMANALGQMRPQPAMSIQISAISGPGRKQEKFHVNRIRKSNKPTLKYAFWTKNIVTPIRTRM